MFFLAWIEFSIRSWDLKVQILQALSAIILLFVILCIYWSLFTFCNPNAILFSNILTMFSVSERKRFDETHFILLLLSPHPFVLFRVWLRFCLIFKCEQLSFSIDQDIVIVGKIHLEILYLLERKERFSPADWIFAWLFTNLIIIFSQ